MLYFLLAFKYLGPSKEFIIIISRKTTALKLKETQAENMIYRKTLAVIQNA